MSESIVCKMAAIFLGLDVLTVPGLYHDMETLSALLYHLYRETTIIKLYTTLIISLLLAWIIFWTMTGQRNEMLR